MIDLTKTELKVIPMLSRPGFLFIETRHIGGKVDYAGKLRGYPTRKAAQAALERIVEGFLKDQEAVRLGRYHWDESCRAFVAD